MKARRKFSKEYKEEAVRLAELRGARAASESLGVDISLLYQWKKRLESEGAEAFRGNGNRTALEEENRQLRLEVRRLREEAETPKKSVSVLCEVPEVKYAFIERRKGEHPVTVLCRVLGVSAQGYYAWRRHPVSARAESNAHLSVKIRVIHAESKEIYGSPRVHDELLDQGIRCGRNRVARLMRAEGRKAKAGRKFRVTTDSSHDKPVASDLVQRNFSATVPNKVWVGDITYLWTAEGWLYLAVFIDLYSRMVVGWSIGTRLHASLVTLAFTRAVARRRPKAGLVVHTDQGSQYASELFRNALAQANARQSMGSRGDCYDNAVAESFFHSFKIEAIYGSDLETRREMEVETFEYIERFYNRKRKHSAIGLRSPEQFENGLTTNRKAAA